MWPPSTLTHRWFLGTVTCRVCKTRTTCAPLLWQCPMPRQVMLLIRGKADVNQTDADGRAGRDHWISLEASAVLQHLTLAMLFAGNAPLHVLMSVFDKAVLPTLMLMAAWSLHPRTERRVAREPQRLGRSCCSTMLTATCLELCPPRLYCTLITVTGCSQHLHAIGVLTFAVDVPRMNSDKWAPLHLAARRGNVGAEMCLMCLTLNPKP